MEDTISILQALQSTYATDENLRNAAQEALLKWEMLNGFAPILLLIVENRELQQQDRLLAILYFKNLISRQWDNISESDRFVIRVRLLQLLIQEQEHQIATHIGLAIANVASVEFPHKCCSTEGAGDKYRILLSLHFALKKSLLKQEGDTYAKQLISDATISMFPIVCQLCLNGTSTLLSAVLNATLNPMMDSAQLDSMLPECEIFTCCLSIIRTLLHCNIVPLSDSSMQKFISSFVLNLTAILSSRHVLQRSSPVLKQAFYRFLKKSAKLSFDVIRSPVQDIARCDNLLTRLMQLHASHLLPSPRQQQSEENGERSIKIQSLIFLHEVLSKCTLWSMDVSNNDNNNTGTRVYQQVEDYFNQTTVVLLAKQLITRYMLLTPQDLALWSSDPEQYVEEEIRDDWENNLRDAATVLYSTLLSKYPLLVGSLVNRLRKEQAPNYSDDLQIILRKDSLYEAMNVGCHNLHDIDFVMFYHDVLSKDLQIHYPNYLIIHKRIIQMMGNWFDLVECSQESFAQLSKSFYCVLLHYLNRGDYVTRVWATVSLRIMIESSKFNVEIFLEVFSSQTESSLNSIVKLVHDANENCTNVEILKMLAAILKQLKAAALPFVPSILGELHSLWTSPKNQTITKAAVLNVLSEILKVTNEDRTMSFSPQFYAQYRDFVWNVLSTSLDLKHPDSVHLLKPASKMWLYLLLTGEITPQLVSLYHSTHFGTMIAQSPESHNIVVKIIHAYILKGTAEFVTSHMESILGVMHTASSWFNNMDTGAQITVSNIAKHLIRYYPKNSLLSLRPLIVTVLTGVAYDTYLHSVTFHALNMLCVLLLDHTNFFFETIDALGRSLQAPNLETLFAQSCVKQIMKNNPGSDRDICLGLCMMLPRTQVIHMADIIVQTVLRDHPFQANEERGRCGSVVASADDNDELTSMLDRITLNEEQQQTKSPKNLKTLIMSKVREAPSGTTILSPTSCSMLS